MIWHLNPMPSLGSDPSLICNQQYIHSDSLILLLSLKFVLFVQTLNLMFLVAQAKFKKEHYGCY